MSNNPINFIRDFLAYVEKRGIYDEFDKDSQKMITSVGIEKLIKNAESYMPEKLKALEASIRMRDLTEAERDKAIGDSEKGRIIDMRKEFQLRMSKNNGAQGIVNSLADALEDKDQDAIEKAIKDVMALSRGPENVIEIKND